MPKANLWLARYAKIVVLATLGLIFVGGLVTSKDAGLSVPDWPTSFGYNMFTYPLSQWIGEQARENGRFFEHSHRLFASAVGLLTTVLALWIWKAESRMWVRRLGVGAFFLVVLQGIFGGLRVTKLSIALAMIHACTAQAFLCVLIALAAALSSRWIDGTWRYSGDNLRSIRVLSRIMVMAVYGQLILGAVMRHLKAGLAIGDFPLAFGQVIPPMWSAQIAIHFAHRVGALAVCIAALLLFWKVFTATIKQPILVVPSVGLAVLVVFQIFLGAHVIWLAKAPLVTTLHVLNGAAILGTSLLIALRATRFEIPDETVRLVNEPLVWQEVRA